MKNIIIKIWNKSLKTRIYNELKYKNKINKKAKLYNNLIAINLNFF